MLKKPTKGLLKFGIWAFPFRNWVNLIDQFDFYFGCVVVVHSMDIGEIEGMDMDGEWLA